MKLNMKKLKEAIHDIHHEIKIQKGDGPSGFPTLYRLSIIKQQETLNNLRKQCNGRYENYPWKEADKLEKMRNAKDYATILYTIRAHHHGRIHMIKRRNPFFGAIVYKKYGIISKEPEDQQPKFLYPNLEDQKKLIEPFINEFLDQVESNI